MNTILKHLKSHKGVSAYKLNITRRESYELFFVKGSLETVRNTDNTDKEVTVYVDHGDFRGHAQFFVYPSTTEEDLVRLVDEAVEKAKLIDNPRYELVAGETGEFAVPTNFDTYDASELAAIMANTVFDANTLDVTSLNAVEIFINRITETVVNSRGLHKKQTRWTAMVEAIPTATENGESVELYEQYNFNTLDLDTLRTEIADKLAQAKARHDAKPMEITGNPKVVLNSQELMELFWNFADDLDYATVYSHGNVYNKGDAIQSDPEGDLIGLTVTASLPGAAGSRCFDRDGMTLFQQRIIDGGKAVAYHGTNRFGQYLGEVPTGAFPCLRLDAGSVEHAEFSEGPYLEIVSMSGIQTDFYADYVGGEIRLAYWHDGEKIIPVTGVSVSGKLSEVLNRIRFSREYTLCGSYFGPKKAIVLDFNIF
ncbi:MAG: hypothetical protein IKD27_04110 [Oscillospiraceae bacterium]|nr:hypothetical protein [Oscillospiraceae bacterium]